jgi:FkbM family methyltransferase
MAQMPDARPTLKIGALELECMNEIEAVMLGDDVPDYFELGLAFAPGMTVLDVGANVGVFSASVHQRLQGDVRLHAFEPSPPVFAILARNLAALGQNVRAHGFGLGKTSSTLELSAFTGMSLLSSTQRDEATLPEERARVARSALALVQEGRVYPLLRFLPEDAVLGLIEGQLAQAMQIQKYAVPIRTLSEVIDEHDLRRIDLLKIDVEGAELDVLAGIEDRHWPAIQQLAIECEEWEARSPILVDLLDARGFRAQGLRGAAQEAGNYGLVAATRQPPK